MARELKDMIFNNKQMSTTQTIRVLKTTYSLMKTIRHEEIREAGEVQDFVRWIRQRRRKTKETVPSRKTRKFPDLLSYVTMCGKHVLNCIETCTSTIIRHPSKYGAKLLWIYTHLIVFHANFVLGLGVFNLMINRFIWVLLL